MFHACDCLANHLFLGIRQRIRESLLEYVLKLLEVRFNWDLRVPNLCPRVLHIHAFRGGQWSVHLPELLDDLEGGVCNLELPRSHGVWDSPVFRRHSFVQSQNYRGLDILFRIVDPLVLVVFHQQVGLSGRIHRRVDRSMWSGVRKIRLRYVASSCIHN